MKKYLNKSNFLLHELTGIFLTIFLFGITSCTETSTNPPELILDARYQKIQMINSYANCLGPNGVYTTEVQSDSDGNWLFIQRYGDSDQPFMAKLTSDNQGYVIDSLDNILDTLPVEAIEMIKSHDFHRIQTQPDQFFTSIEFFENFDDETELYHAVDKLKYPVKLYYNRTTKQLSKIDLINPIDTTQSIQVIHKKWMDSDYGQLVKEIEIVQAERDTFYFNFESVEIN